MSNRQLLIDRLYASYVDRVQPDEAGKKKTAHMQAMAQLLGVELIALAAGRGECPRHHDQVAGVCQRCAGIWPDESLASAKEEADE